VIFRVSKSWSGEAARSSRGDLRRNRDFVRLWTSEVVSTLGSSTASLAYPLLALGITGSAAQAGLLALVGQSAGAVMRLPAGSLIDRIPLRRVLVTSDVVRAGTTAAAAASLLTGHLTMGSCWHWPR
jgi:MFS family permease